MEIEVLHRRLDAANSAVKVPMHHSAKFETQPIAVDFL